MDNVMRARGLVRRFGGNTALDGLTLEVPAGSIFALVGPNGAGKTTAIETWMGLRRPTAGSTEVLGADSRRLSMSDWQRIGYVSENQRLPEWMKVGYFLEYCREFYPRWEAAGLVRGFDLPLGRAVKELSRGMKVKLAFAASLAYSPELLVLDEPFSGLDVLVRDELIEALLERAGPMTVFLASHDLAEIESFASHVAYLEAGRVRFVEEMAGLSARFREVEVTGELRGAAAESWIGVERGETVVRFVETRWDSNSSEAAIRERFAELRDVVVRPITLRGIVVALARAGRGKGGAR